MARGSVQWRPQAVKRRQEGRRQGIMRFAAFAPQIVCMQLPQSLLTGADGHRAPAGADGHRAGGQAGGASSSGGQHRGPTDERLAGWSSGLGHGPASHAAPHRAEVIPHRAEVIPLLAMAAHLKNDRRLQLTRYIPGFHGSAESRSLSRTRHSA